MFNAAELELLAMNERHEHDIIVAAVKNLRFAMDKVAAKAAKANADWHDDPSCADHKKFHAPAEKQFKRPSRDRAILNLVRHYLTEANLENS